LERYSDDDQVYSLQSVLQRDPEILVMRQMVVRELIAHSERAALHLRIENRSDFVRLVLLELRVLVLTVHHCTAPFPHPPTCDSESAGASVFCC
jgi:hypothetical protein